MAEVEGRIAVRVLFPKYEDTPAVLTNQMTVQFLGDVYVVTFYAALPPMLPGELPETAEPLDAPAKCVARLAIPAERMAEIVRALSQSVERSHALVARSQTTPPAGESDDRHRRDPLLLGHGYVHVPRRLPNHLRVRDDPQGLGRDVPRATRRYCQAVFENLAEEDPEELASIIRQNRAPDSRLTFAVEILGRDVDRPWVAATLMDILRTHRSPLVREGAVLGLFHHLDRIGVREALREAMVRDPSDGVKSAAQDVLDGE